MRKCIEQELNECSTGQFCPLIQQRCVRHRCAFWDENIPDEPDFDIDTRRTYAQRGEGCKLVNKIID